MDVRTHLRNLSGRVQLRQRGGIMDFFRTPATQQTPPQGTQTQQTQQTDANGVVPKQPDQNTTTQQQTDPNASPLDQFKDLWKTPDNSNNQPKPIFEGLDPAKIREGLSKVNVVGEIPPELAAKIKAGGEDAIQALIQIQNSTAQKVLADSTVSTTKIVEAALEKQQERFMAQIPAIIKKATANDALMTENPMLKHPAVQPVVEALQQQFLTKNPNATQSEINTQVMDVLKTMGAVFNPASPKNTDSNGNVKQEEDWSKFLMG